MTTNCSRIRTAVGILCLAASPAFGQAAWDFVYWGDMHPNDTGGFSGPRQVDLPSGQIVEVVPDGDALSGTALHIVSQAGVLWFNSIPANPFSACGNFTVEARIKVAPGINNISGCANGNERTNILLDISGGGGITLDSDDVWLFWNQLVGTPCFNMDTTDAYHTYRLTITSQPGGPRWRFYIDGELRWLQDFSLSGTKFGFGDLTNAAGWHDAQWDYVARTCGAYSPDELPSPPPLIPTVSGWGLVAMALLVLTAGTLVCVRRRAAHA